jgi:hypothetical protein
VEKLPIGKDEWKSGSKYAAFEEQILSFLKRNQDSAFTLSEIVAGLGYSIEIRDFGSFVSGVAGYWLLQNAIENFSQARNGGSEKNPVVYRRANLLQGCVSLTDKVKIF